MFKLIEFTGDFIHFQSKGFHFKGRQRVNKYFDVAIVQGKRRWVGMVGMGWDAWVSRLFVCLLNHKKSVLYFGLTFVIEDRPLSI